MAITTKFEGTTGPFAHMFYFDLADTEPEFVQRFINLCVKFLGGHPGQQHFSVGVRALQINREVSAMSFEVAVNMIFDSYDTYLDYQKDPKHQEFITRNAGMSPARVVYDSYIQVSQVPSAAGTGKKSAAGKAASKKTAPKKKETPRKAAPKKKTRA